MHHFITIAALFLAPLAGAGTVTLEIHHLWKSKPLAVPSGDLTTASGETIDISRLSYLLSEPRLLRRGDNDTSGDWVQRNDWFAFVDASGGVARVTLSGLPPTKFTSLQFHVGVDEKTDQSDPNSYPAKHPLNPLVNNLHWTPQGGYIYFALEGHLRSGEGSGFAYHLGNAWNRMPVLLHPSADLSRNATVEIEFHLDRLFDTDPAFSVAKESSTHSRKDDPVAALLKQRVEGAFTLRRVRQAAPKAKDTAPKPPREIVGTPYRFRIAKGFPIPDLPVDYPLTNERVALGKALFHEKKLSRSNTQSCSSCHLPEHGFTDGLQFSIGHGGREGTRNSMPIFNLAWKDSFFWDGRASSLRAQALVPIESPIELHESLDHVVKKLTADPAYPPLFKRAFGTQEITADRIGIAIEQFELTLTSYDSRFDRAARGEDQLTDQERRGFELFMTEYDPRRGQLGADCFHCHGGALFTDHRFHNNGLRDEDDYGLEQFTGKKSDRNKFATPSLRNIALTAPYMHDGRFATLEEVIEHYDSGLHRSATLDPNLAKHPPNGLGLSKEDKAALVAFLKALSDPQYAK